MKNRIAILLGTISVLVLLAIIMMAYLMLRHPDKVTLLNEALEKTSQQHKLVVLDFDDNGLLDAAELMQGRDAVIAVSNPRKGVDELFNSVSAFQRLDINKDGRIDEKDPLYRYMNLMFFSNNGKDHRYMSFAQAGIKYIQINQKRLNKSDVSLHVNDNIIGQAVLTNGKQHRILLISVDVH